MGDNQALSDTKHGQFLSSAGMRYAAVIATGIFVYLLVFKLPFTPFLNESDHHMFLYEGMRLLDGDTMYRDFFQFTFPGTQAYYWLLFSIFGLKYWNLSATIVLIAILSVWSCLLVSKAVIENSLFYMPAVLFIFFGFRWNGLDGTHRMFSPIFVMLAIWILLRRSDVFGLMLAGMFCAFASFFTQQRGVLVVIAIAVFLVFDGLYLGRKGREIATSISVIAFSFLLVLLTLCSYFIFTAGPSDFFAATVSYPANYYHYASYNNFGVLSADLKKSLDITDFSKTFSASGSIFYLFILPITYLVFGLLFLLKRKTQEWVFWRSIVLTALVGGALTFTITAPNTNRLFQISMPGLIVFVWLINYFGKEPKIWLSRFAPRFLVGLTAIVTLLGMTQAYRIQTNQYQLLETPSGTLVYNPSEIIDKRYVWLMERTVPGDLVFEAYQPFIYFPLLLRNPTKYAQIWDSDYTRPEHVGETLSDLEAKRPRYILWNNDNNKPDESRLASDHMAPLSRYLQQNYRPASEIIENSEGQIQIWERIN